MFKNNLYEMPETQLARLSSLRNLDLSDNKLRHSTVQNLVNVRSLTLSGNKLDSVEVFFSSTASSLSALDLSKNCLTSVPENINELFNLARLDLSDNPELVEVPPSCVGIVTLEELRLDGNTALVIPPREMTATNDISWIREYFRNLCEITSAFQMKSMREYTVQQDDRLAAELFRSLGVSCESGEQAVDLSALAVQLSTATNRDAAKIIAKLTRTSHDVEILALFSNPSFFQREIST